MHYCSYRVFWYLAMDHVRIENIPDTERMTNTIVYWMGPFYASTTHKSIATKTVLFIIFLSWESLFFSFSLLLWPIIVIAFKELPPPVCTFGCLFGLVAICRDWGFPCSVLLLVCTRLLWPGLETVSGFLLICHKKLSVISEQHYLCRQICFNFCSSADTPQTCMSLVLISAFLARQKSQLHFCSRTIITFET